MKYRLTNFPVLPEAGAYDRAIESCADFFSRHPGIVSVYRIGSVSDPGISDLDVIAVFEDGASCDADPLAAFSPGEKRLFTHSVFAISLKHFCDNLVFGGYRGYVRIWGRELLEPGRADGESPPGVLELRRQMAMEFLLANVLARTADKYIGVLNVRGLLLSSKAVRWDLELLGEDDGGLRSSIESAVEWRSRWFSRPPDRIALLAWFHDYHRRLLAYAERLSRQRPLFVPGVRRYAYGRNIRIRPGSPFRIAHRGIPLPLAVLPSGGLHRKAGRFLHRLDCRVPMKVSQDPLMRGRFAFYEEMAAHNRARFPKFNILANPMVHRLTRSPDIRSR